MKDVARIPTILAEGQYRSDVVVPLDAGAKITDEHNAANDRLYLERRRGDAGM